MERFLEFLLTGTVDGLGVGAGAADVGRRLGAPDDTSAIRPPIWKYGPMEVTIRDGYVVMIAVRAHVDPEAVTKMLDEAGVVYELYPALTYDDQIAYVIGGSGVTVTLDTTRLVARGFAT